ncbi:MAG: hypothetical protein EOP86_09015, partial [Verrucomicrobiaceae bacterium]
MLTQELEKMAGFRRRRLLRHALIRAAGVLLALLALAAVVDVFLGIPLIWRWMILAGSTGVAVWDFGRSGGWRALSADAAGAARLCEAAHPECGQSIRTALELASGKSAASPPLAQALMGRALDQIRRLDHARLLTPAGWRKVAVGAGVAAAVWILLLTAWPDFRAAALRSLGVDRGFSQVALSTSGTAAPGQPVRVEAAIQGRRTDDAVLHWRAAGSESEWRTESMTAVAARRFDAVLTAGETELECYAVSGDSTSPVLRIAVRVPARAQVVKTTITPPAYLAQAPKEQEKGDIDAPEDSTAEVTVAFNRPVMNARLVPSQGQPVTLTMSGGSRQGTARLAVSAGSLTWHVAGQDADGHPVESDVWQLTGRADSLPSIRLLEPVDETSATAIWELPARLRAKDDHGLARVGITLRLAGKETPLFEKDFEAGDIREAAELAILAMDTMPLGITDNLQVFAWATDRKPRAGNARSVTPIANIDIRQFQTRKLDAPPCECAGECVNLVEKMIAAQRHVLSDSFQLKETSTWREVSPEDTQPLAGREMEIAGTGQELLTKMQEAAASGFDLGKDGQLATEALQQVNFAVTALQQVALESGCDHEDKALTHLLQLRREIMKKMGKGGKQAKPKKKDEDRPPSLGELAQRLDKVAGEERDVAEQAGRLPGNTACPEPLRGQQLATVAELGMIAGELDRHQGLTDLVRERMDHSEAAAAAAGEKLVAGPPDAVAPLHAAEAQTRELAAHLRLLENQAGEQSLAQMEKNAREAAKELEACASCQGACQSSATAAAAARPGTGDGGQARASGEKTAPARARQLAERSATVNDVLSGGRKAEGGDSSNKTADQESLPDPAQTKALADGMNAWAKAVELKSAGPGAEETDTGLAEQARGLAARQHRLADVLQQSLAAVRQAQVDKLLALRKETQSRQRQAQTRELAAQKSAGNQGQTGNGNSGNDGSGNSGTDGPTADRNGAPPQEADSPGPALMADAEYQKRLEGTGDQELKAVIGYLAQAPVPDSGVFSYIDQRLTVLISQFSRTALAAKRSGRVPPFYQRT